MSGIDSVNGRTWIRRFITPEGVDLRLEVANFSQRSGAFIIDIAILLGVLIALTILCLFAAVGGRNPIVLQAIAVIWLLGFFLLRNGYFLHFEMSPRAATPGKRLMKLRVATRDGGALTVTAVFARNAMREVEFYLPALFLVSRAHGVDAVLILLGVLWTGALALFPLFNRDRLRLGDLLAGTWVVLAPVHRLLPDMAGTPLGTAAPEHIRFSKAQLDLYGVKELQVLEQVLRRRNMETVRGVADRIRTKIGWVKRSHESDFEFLDAYYAALRARLEQQMLLGRRRKDKFDIA
jgi:uncharacterized RDD family membrane protein YckC